MAWKSLKRYLDFVGVDAKTPRDVFKEAYALQIINDQEVWLDMIERRNLSSHIYDEYEISGILDKKEEYKRAFLHLRKIMEENIAQ